MNTIVAGSAGRDEGVRPSSKTPNRIERTFIGYL
jgi:hypothetical protein